MTARQFYIIVCFFVITTKMQRFASLLFSETGKDGYLIILIYALINIIGILLAFFIYKFLNTDKFKNQKTNIIFSFLKKFVMLATSIYFLIQALLLFEHVQNIFADTLFDKFSWSIFSLLFLFTIFFLAKTGLKNIALNFELYSFLIGGALVMIAVLGAFHSDYSFVLPFETINFQNLMSNAGKFNIWFGDFFIILYMLFHTNKPKLSKTLLSYFIGISFVVFLIITYFGVYGDYSALQAGLVSSITEQSMLGLNIGRVDWFLILIAEFGTILSCSVCIYFANKTLGAAFPKIKPLYLTIAIAIAFYITNVFVLVDKFIVKDFFFGTGGWLSIILKLFTTFALLLISIKDLKLKKKLEKQEAHSG